MSPLHLPEGLAWTILATTSLVLALLLPFGVHRALLLRARFRGRARSESEPGQAGGTETTPHVTVQLPLFNEAMVVDRLIDAVGRLEHPDDFLEIQVLDDSTDDTPGRVAAALQRIRGRRNCRLRHLRRTDRTGFKAGALARGVEEAAGDVFLILDADFVPAPDLLRRLLPALAEPGVGVVQARWDHLNEDERLLTRGQARILDGHFLLEQDSRARSGRFLNFNGTAGIWRREALEAAGGWSADTLTEDMDVSYRAQLAGWKIAFLPHVGVPAELPGTVRAFEVQQQRWAQGAVQTARKILPAIWSSAQPLATRLEATAHLTGHVAHALTLALGLLLLPSALARQALELDRFLVVDLVVFVFATLSFVAFYGVAGRLRDRPWRQAIPEALLALGLGVGLTASVTPAVVAGLRRNHRNPFHRTPKRGGQPTHGRYRSPGGRVERIFRWCLAGWAGGGLVVALAWGLWASVPFLALFTLGWGGLALADWRDRHPGTPAAAQPSVHRESGSVGSSPISDPARVFTGG